MARIDPYAVHPAPPAIALLLPTGLALEETGQLHDLDALPLGVKPFGSWDVVDELMRQGVGEAFYWEDEPVRWRHRRYRDAGGGGWEKRPNDVTVLRLPFPDEQRALEGLVGWRDWLAEYRAAPQGSLGSTGMSLLRATLEATLLTARGDLPPIGWTLGGRQQLGVNQAPGATVTSARHFDLPAAYARELGHLRYGGLWRRLEGPDAAVRVGELSAQVGAPVFAHATVRLPGLLYGPLPRRGRKRPDKRSPLDQFLRDDPMAQYPTDGRITGTWTWQELEQAQRAGATVDVDEAWVHVTEGDGLGQPFLPWWDAVTVGRAMSSRFGATLAKACANAVWGQFAIGKGRRQLVSYVNGERKVVELPVPGGDQPRSWDLAETITGRVRAALFGMIEHAGAALVSVHTDGGWVQAPLEPPDGWAVKDEARRLDVIGPQVLRYWPEDGGPYHCVSGVPARMAPRVFESLWQGLKIGEAWG